MERAGQNEEDNREGSRGWESKTVRGRGVNKKKSGWILPPSPCKNWLAVWLSGNALVSINVVTLRWAG